MILEVLYHHPISVAGVIASVIGILIGIGLLIGTLILNSTHKIKPGQLAVFSILSIAIIAVGIYSLVNSLS